MNKKMGKVTRNYKLRTRNENIIGIKLEKKTTDNEQSKAQTNQTRKHNKTRDKKEK